MWYDRRMNRRQYCKITTAAVLVALAMVVGEARAAQCGNTAAGFEGWKREFAGEARARGVGASAVAALMGTSYATATIAADRGMKSFRLSLDQFLAKRGAAAIVSRGRALKQTHAALFASIEQRYGVPPGPLLAIWGMETAFGSQRGNQNVLSAVATLAYDCRRSAYFTDQLYAAMTLIERGVLSAGTRGSMHGEYGQTQFMPKSILNYGTGALPGDHRQLPRPHVRRGEAAAGVRRRLDPQPAAGDRRAGQRSARAAGGAGRAGGRARRLVT